MGTAADCRRPSTETTSEFSTAHSQTSQRSTHYVTSGQTTGVTLEMSQVVSSTQNLTAQTTTGIQESSAVPVMMPNILNTALVTTSAANQSYKPITVSKLLTQADRISQPGSPPFVSLFE